MGAPRLGAAGFLSPITVFLVLAVVFFGGASFCFFEDSSVSARVYLKEARDEGQMIERTSLSPASLTFPPSPFGSSNVPLSAPRLIAAAT